MSFPRQAPAKFEIVNLYTGELVENAPSKYAAKKRRRHLEVVTGQFLHIRPKKEPEEQA